MLSASPAISLGRKPSASTACASSVTAMPLSQRFFQRPLQDVTTKHLRRQCAPQFFPERQFARRARHHRHASMYRRSARQAIRPPRRRAIHRASSSRSAAGKQGRAASCTSTQSSGAACVMQDPEPRQNGIHALRASRGRNDFRMPGEPRLRPTLILFGQHHHDAGDSARAPETAPATTRSRSGRPAAGIAWGQPRPCGGHCRPRAR